MNNNPFFLMKLIINGLHLYVQFLSRSKTICLPNPFNIKIGHAQCPGPLYVNAIYAEKSICNQLAAVGTNRIAK